MKTALGFCWSSSVLALLSSGKHRAEKERLKALVLPCCA